VPNWSREALKDFDGDAIVLFGDTPFISPETLTKVFEARKTADVVVLGFQAKTPGGYGRLITKGDKLLKITEAKDCTPEELKIDLCNSGVMAAKSEILFDLISDVTPNNAQSELYLTDIVGIANDRGMTCAVVTCPEAETLGINSRSHLAQAEAIFQAKRRDELMEEGVTLTDPSTTFLAFDTHIGRDVIIGPNTLFGPGVTIETGAHIKGFCHLEGCHISEGAEIGPFARLRPGAEIGDNARVGNFVEIKNTELATGAKVGHLTYLGDTTVGTNSNIGAGTVTCNYDGVFKHQTQIGEDVFIGTHTSLVAPVKVGDGAFTATGSVIVTPLEILKSHADPINAVKMAAYHKVDRPYLGVSNLVLNDLAKDWRKTHTPDERLRLADALWQTNIHEARITAGKLLTQARIRPDCATWSLITSWVPQFDAWAIADQVSSAGGKRLTADPSRLDEVETWTTSEHLWTKRAALVMTLPWTKQNHPSKAEEQARDRILGWAATYVTDPHEELCV